MKLSRFWDLVIDKYITFIAVSTSPTKVNPVLPPPSPVLCLITLSPIPLFVCPSLSAQPKSALTPSSDIRDAHDAHIVLEAVRLNILPLIKRRLLSNEREDLRSGQVYVWEEAQDDGGLLRWTDGRRWFVVAFISSCTFSDDLRLGLRAE